jgi:hypothetical protein
VHHSQFSMKTLMHHLKENYLATRFQNYITYVTEEYTDLIRHVVVLTVH